MEIKIIPNEKGNPPGKLADAELIFTDGPLAGLKLAGFSIWERRGAGPSRNVTFPARTYSVNGERRSFALLRQAAEGEEGLAGQNRVRDAILKGLRGGGRQAIEARAPRRDGRSVCAAADNPKLQPSDAKRST